MTPGKASTLLTCAAVSLLTLSSAKYLPAAEDPPGPPPTPPQDAGAVDAPKRAGVPSPYDTLVAPIALYPDPLIALILPASTVPSDIAAAAAYLVQYGDMTRIDSQPWDPSVRALAHYPTVITWMADNMDWTQALGAAFLASPAGVMDSVQRLRARALAAGALVSTPQQQVYMDNDEIEIVPAQPDAVYIPVYDESVVYSEDPYYGYGGPFENFGEAYPAGAWLSYAFDWRRHRVWAGAPGTWNGRAGWQPPRFQGDQPPPGARAWHPPDGPRRAVPPAIPVHGTGIPQPRAMPGAPDPPPSHYRMPASAPLTASAPEGVPVPRTAAPMLGRPVQSFPGNPVAGSAPAAPAEVEPRSIPPQEPPRVVRYEAPVERGPVETSAAPDAPAREAPPPPPRAAPPAPPRAVPAPAAGREPPPQEPANRDPPR